MRKLLLITVASIGLAQSALAQVATPTAPTAPTVATPTVETPAMTQTGSAATTAQPDVTQQLQKLMGNKNAQQSLSQVMVIGTLLGCTQKQAGQEATQAFYKEMQQTGKIAEGYCKQGNAAQARQLMLDTVYAKRNDPVVKSLLMCYEQQRMNLVDMAGQKMATDMEHYARWVRDPSLMSKEMKESDICKNIKTN